MKTLTESFQQLRGSIEKFAEKIVDDRKHVEHVKKLERNTVPLSETTGNVLKEVDFKMKVDHEPVAKHVEVVEAKRPPVNLKTEESAIFDNSYESMYDSARTEVKKLDRMRGIMNTESFLAGANRNENDVLVSLKSKISHPKFRLLKFNTDGSFTYKYIGIMPTEIPELLRGQEWWEVI